VIAELADECCDAGSFGAGQALDVGAVGAA
jgi:hypothetical protein